MAAENFFGPAYYGDPGVPHANPDEFSTIAMATALYLGVKHVLKFKAKLWTNPFDHVMVAENTRLKISYAKREKERGLKAQRLPLIKGNEDETIRNAIDDMFLHKASPDVENPEDHMRSEQYYSLPMFGPMTGTLGHEEKHPIRRIKKFKMVPLPSIFQTRTEYERWWGRDGLGHFNLLPQEREPPIEPYTVRDQVIDEYEEFDQAWDRSWDPEWTDEKW